jgi:hypothetical protein
MLRLTNLGKLIIPVLLLAQPVLASEEQRFCGLRSQDSNQSVVVYVVYENTPRNRAWCKRQLWKILKAVNELDPKYWRNEADREWPSAKWKKIKNWRCEKVLGLVMTEEKANSQYGLDYQCGKIDNRMDMALIHKLYADGRQAKLRIEFEVKAKNKK